MNSASEAPSSTLKPGQHVHPAPQSPSSRGSDFAWPHLTPELLTIIDNAFTLPHSAEEFPEEILDTLRSQSLLDKFTSSLRVRRLAEGMILSSRPQRALRVLALAHRLGCSLKKDVYENLARQLAENRQWQLVPPLVQLAKRQMGRINVRLLNWLIRGLTETHQFTLLDGILLKFKEEKAEPNQRTFHLLMFGHIRNHNLQAAVAVLQQMQEVGYSIDATTQAAVASAYRTLGSDMLVQTQSLDALPSADSLTSTLIANALMQLAVDADDADNVILFTHLFDPGRLQIPHTFRPGRTITGTAGKNVPLHSRPRSSSRLQLPSLDRPVAPDAASFTILLNYMARRKDILSASSLVEQMLFAGVEPDSRVAAALMRVYFSVGDYAAAVNIFAQACHKHPAASIPLSSIAFLPAAPRSLIWSNLRPTVELGNGLARGLLDIDGLDGFRLALKIMQASDIVPNPDTILIVISYLESVENQPPGDLIRTLRYLSDTFDHSTLKQLHVILRSILRRERQPITRSGWNVTPPPSSQKPSKVATGDNLFDPTAGIEFEKHYSLLRPIIQSLTSRNVRSDRPMVHIRTQHEAVAKGDLNKARHVFQVMLDRGMYPNKYHYAALMEGHALASDLPAAQSVLDAAIKAGVQPTVVHYTILINGHARLLDPESAMQAFQDMVTQGIAPDVAAVDALVGAYVAIRNFSIARKILTEFWILIQPFPAELHGVPMKELMKAFRALDSSTQTRLTNKQTRLLRWKLKRISSHKAWQQRIVVSDEDEDGIKNYQRQKERRSRDVVSSTKYDSH